MLNYFERRDTGVELQKCRVGAIEIPLASKPGPSSPGFGIRTQHSTARFLDQMFIAISILIFHAITQANTIFELCVSTSGPFYRKQLSNGSVELSCIQIDKENGSVKVWPPGEAGEKQDLKSPASSNPESGGRIKVSSSEFACLVLLCPLYC